MLRFHYMPSDFHPLLLIVGERSDISVLGKFFTRFAQSHCATQVNVLQGFGYQNIAIKVVPTEAERPRGLVFAPGEEKLLVWELNRDKALEYADEIAEIVDADSKSGSCFLEVGYVGEIRAKAVFGEFDDSYLLEDGV